MIKYYSLGGQDERFRYCGVLECGGEILLLNAGGSCVNTNLYDIEEIIPDYQFLTTSARKLKGLFISSPRPLNISSIPYLLELFPNLPIYTNSFGKSIIESFLREFESKSNKKVNANIIPLDLVSEHTISGDCKAIPIKVASSLPHSLAWAFKFSQSDYVVFVDEFLIASENIPCRESQLDWLYKNLKGKISLLIVGMQSCSTVSSFALKQADNFSFLKKLVSRITTRLIIASYSDSWDTLFNMSKIAHIYKYQLAIYPNELATLFNSFITQNKLENHSLAIKVSELSSAPDKPQLVVITGDHNTLYSNLREIHRGSVKNFSLKQDDVIMFMTHTYIEREIEEISIINELADNGGEVLKQPNTLQPYLAGAEDIMLLINCLSPFHVVPVNGFYKDYVAFLKALENVMNTQKVYFLENGQLITINRKNIDITDQAVSETYIGKQSSLELNKMTLFEKRLLSQSGVVLVTLRNNTKKNGIKVPHIELLNVFANDFQKTEEVISKIRYQLNIDISKYLQHNLEIDNKTLKQAVRKSIYNTLDSYLHKKPAVLSVISHI
ncbi:hypothetical protein WEN_03390 [Mycoplasma wenyonii str. Massachusetts]|uniref:Ribonuclease J C-terminal domain-containing protein n=1 Tax=Mycoplasma wenyonii (strain Massachusetts) TaxID=1197325 RepID=I6ZJR6_MYCWM|nr:ribonuclease J [Mycoplasma wenyonii]AFN65455.1 hypothetical protein WEN_03390 [Mycoplasma wenyonii str. Massachusetts]